MLMDTQLNIFNVSRNHVSFLFLILLSQVFNLPDFTISVRKRNFSFILLTYATAYLQSLNFYFVISLLF